MRFYEKLLQVNEKGERFANELGRRDYVTDRILRFCSPNALSGGAHVAYMLMSDQMVDDFGRPSFNFYANVKGLFKVHLFSSNITAS